MLLIDVGNTSIHFAVEENKRIIKTFYLDTARADIEAIGNAITPYHKDKILVCSVVPRATTLFKDLNQGNIFFAGDYLKVPIKSLYNRKMIGMDRLVGAFAAKQIYPRTRLVIDFGTAITFDFLSPGGDYLGGLILPGVGSSLNVLSNCALLPNEINLRKTSILIPRNTKDSISQGIVEGFSLMINALVKKYCKLLRFPAKSQIIITGGGSDLIINKLKFPYISEPFLIFKGLMMLGKHL